MKRVLAAFAIFAALLGSPAFAGDNLKTSAQPLATGTANAALSFDLMGNETVMGGQITGLTAAGATLTIEGSTDGRRKDDVNKVWFATVGIPFTCPSPATFTTINADGQFKVDVSGLTNVRIRVSSTGTGNALVSLNAIPGSTLGSCGGTGGGSSGGSVNIHDSAGNNLTSTGGALNVAGVFSATLGVFQPSASGSRMAPLTVQLTDSNQTLPTGAVVVVDNTDATNPIYCNVVGVPATIADQKITANSWFSFSPGAQTLLHCIATGAPVVANGTGGAGIPAGAGGGGSAGSTWPGTAGVGVGGASAGSNTMPFVNNYQVNATPAGSNSIGTVGLNAGSNAIGSITNTGFGITGTLPAFAATPTVNLGTLGGAATAANQEVTSPGTSAAGAQGVQGVTGGVHFGSNLFDGSGSPITSSGGKLDVNASFTGGSVTIVNPVDTGNGGVQTTSAPNITTTGVITTADVGQTCTSTGWGNQTACTGTSTAGGAVQVSVKSAGYVWIQGNTTSGSPTVNFQIRISNDGGTTWFNRGLFAITNLAPFQVNGFTQLNFAGWMTGGMTNVEVSAPTYTGSGSTTITVTQGQSTPFTTSSATSSSGNGTASTAATNIQGNGPSALPVGINSQQLAGIVLAAPTAVGTPASGNVPTVNASIVGGTVTATIGGFSPNGNNIAPVTVGASATAAAAVPGGTSVMFQNVGANRIYVRIGAAGVTATAQDVAIEPSSGCVEVLSGAVDFSAISPLGSTLVANGGSGLGSCPSGGGGGGSASGNVFQANLFVPNGSKPGTASSNTVVEQFAASGSLTTYLVNYSAWVDQGQTSNATFQIVTGTGTNCAAGQFPLTPLREFGPGNGIAFGDLGTLNQSAAGGALCVKTTTTTPISFTVGATQQ